MPELSHLSGFFKIPGYSQYLIDKTGSVISHPLFEEVVGWRGANGYYNLSMTSDAGTTALIGRHRLLACVFKHPGKDVKDLVVNHIDGNKENDSLDNLEWVTYQENAEHAGRLGLTRKCLPIQVRDVDSGQVDEYASLIECARSLGISKDAIAWRVKADSCRVYPERKQYRLAAAGSEWPVSVGDLLTWYGRTRPVDARNVMTGEVRGFDSLTQLAGYLDVALPTVQQWLTAPNQPVVSGMHQLKWREDKTPWRDVQNPYYEHEIFSGKRVVLVTNQSSGEEQIFLSAIDCAKALGIRPTALTYRLKSEGKTVFPDGLKFKYYNDRSSNKQGPVTQQ
ncbi:HNH endonuclease [Paraburkholderia sp. BCC1886]|uniref:HNH endonuclease n=1 Tax=Paraburkholderia sp. BCC1886 TaxID=2562670 RepID=UPI00118378E5|nr:HNH endonuclease [Paraburkholderia sp. BCC1886]